MLASQVGLPWALLSVPITVVSLASVNERKLSSDRKSSVLKFTENGERSKARLRSKGLRLNTPALNNQRFRIPT